MLSNQRSEICESLPPAALQGFSMEAGRPSQRKFWSSLKEVCDLLRIPCSASAADGEMLFQHVQFKTGQRIHAAGQAFESFFVVNSGFLKTASVDEFGNEQVLGFPMKGDVLGVDGIYTRQYSSEAVALSDCNLILLPFKKLTALGRSNVEFEHLIYGVMSRELVCKQSMVSMLGTLGAEARVARFLATLSERFEEIGYSKKTFILRMTRQEIGSYLGLSLETVSRTLSALNEIGLISVDQRTIKIKNGDMLKILRRIPSARLRTKQHDAGKQTPHDDWQQLEHSLAN